MNLGCIDLSPWYAPGDDVHRPDVLHFDLDPVEKPPARAVARTLARQQPRPGKDPEQCTFDQIPRPLHGH